MRLLLDMGLSCATAEYVRSLGHDAVHLRDLGMQRTDDARIIEYALAERRVIVTCDLDFTSILARAGQSLPSVILFRLPVYTTSRINVCLVDVIDAHAQALQDGAIVVVEHARVRVRALPIR